MATATVREALLAGLNPAQRRAVEHGKGPLLIVAGAGTGKTATLVHRVAWLVAATGADPSRILLLTFTRRAAAEMLRRAAVLLDRVHNSHGRQVSGGIGSKTWGGTFHAVATRLLRVYGKHLGLPADFTIHDRTDSEDLIHVLRTELGLAKADRRFPKKATCMAIYSRCVNSQQRLDRVLTEHFPWCAEWPKELKQLFDAYVERKELSGVLDYDDLLLYWLALPEHEVAGHQVRRLFDYVLVDEYQDTNVLQARIIYRLCPDGQGLTVVGDDAQSIYAFRAATVRNILDFPKHYRGTTVVALEQNYRSTQPVLDAANRVIALAKERYEKELWSEHRDGPRPLLVTCRDESDQADWIVGRILQLRESGIDLHRQAVLFRASHHSIALEAELAQRDIPYHKYGGLKFAETAHVKDLLAFLRLAENPRDMVAGMRLLVMLPGVGPKTAKKLMDRLLAAGGDWSVWARWKPPPASAKRWPKLVELLRQLAKGRWGLSEQVHRARSFYGPILEELYDNPQSRARDLEQLEAIAARYRDRRTMLVQLALDPPSSTQELAGPPDLDDDYLVLSTIHSAKGLEWDAVYVIHASDGNIPSDMATVSDEQIEEERRLFYVALTRAKRWLAVCYPQCYYHSPHSGSSHYGLAQLTRFIPQSVRRSFEHQLTGESSFYDDAGSEEDSPPETSPRASPMQRTRRLWQ